MLSITHATTINVTAIYTTINQQETTGWEHQYFYQAKIISNLQHDESSTIDKATAIILDWEM